MANHQEFPLLARVDGPADLKRLSVDELEDLCKELRTYVWQTITRVGGHLSASLGVVELTVALHYLYDTPGDRIVWDVGHQSYIHKVLTGRRDRLPTIRQLGGLSGFCKRTESPYDTFGAGHASTAISAALGMATARDLKGEQHDVVAVVGDGGMTGGLAFEGLNNAGAAGRRLVVVLNDNKMSISPNVGALSRYLTNIISSPVFNKAKAEVWQLSEHFPKTDTFRRMVRKVEESLKSLLVPGQFFEDLGFRYLGPIDGHDLREILSVVRRVKTMDGPVLLHVVTKKGKGIAQAEGDPLKYHGVKALARSNGKIEAPPPKPTYTDVFAYAACRLAREDERVVAVTAAMSEGTKLVRFGREHPDRFFDVGIAEGHAVTFSASLAVEGVRPIAAIYSTFLQRAYDQIIHDVALQKLPVLFCLDRAGLVGEDGPTHHGAFDLSYLACVPGMVVAAPKDGRELCDLMWTGISQADGPFAIRFPRDTIPDALDPDEVGRLSLRSIPIGSWEVLRPGGDLVLLAVGSMVQPALACADRLDAAGRTIGVVSCRFVKPLDESLLEQILRETSDVVTLEEGSLEGGFGASISRFAADRGHPTRILQIGLADDFVEHGKRALLLDRAGLSADQIEARIREWRVAAPRHGSDHRTAVSTPETGRAR
ncbi:MAG: 1-deoxy-D-xylulose-5-phosphate synthase [Candidatus Eisenbacteria bacterium]|nr:1-deoxy-D-xylulose-5-phosphate synthase [Candidatus Latescibacterota bacterium]MBD3301502.1 1-deoxy-D-xylulose-5-phosphate synthase [Candidatus Eisenbacteria bacterium]